LSFMAKKTPDEELNIGDRVRCLEIPVNGFTGTIIRRGRVLHLKVWVVQLDRPASRGAGQVRVRKLQKLTLDEDPAPTRG
jgi:hypothetical protein